MLRSVALLTLDAGSMLYNPTQMPDEIVLKHTDGELNKIQRSKQGKWTSRRRQELDVNFTDDGRHRSAVTALAGIADRQAFGFRVDGEPVNPLGVDGSRGAPETIEIEGLNLGGIVVEDPRQLPFGVYTTEEVYYRAYLSEDDETEEVVRPLAVLEKRHGPGGEWEELTKAEPSEAGALLNVIAEETEMETISGDADDMESVIDEQQQLFKASRSREEEAVRGQMAIQNKTVFPPTAPPPRPIDFPD